MYGLGFIELIGFIGFIGLKGFIGLRVWGLGFRDLLLVLLSPMTLLVEGFYTMLFLLMAAEGLWVF